MPVWHDPYWAERGQRHGHDVAFQRLSGSGSISTLSIDESEVEEARKRRIQIGFCGPGGPDVRDWGEAAWTAPDLIDRRRLAS